MIGSLSRHVVRFFPPPRFLSMAGVGLDISDTHIYFIELNKQGPKRMLLRYGCTPLPKGVFQNGELVNPTLLKETLQTFQAAHGFHFAHVSLPEPKGYLYQTLIPSVRTRGELESAISFTLEENVPLAPQEASFSYVPLRLDSRGKSLSVSVSVYARKIIDEYSDLLQASSITPLSFELDLRAASSACVKKGDARPYMLVHISRNRTGIAIISQGIAVYAASVSVGSDTLTSAVAKYFSVSMEEAEKIKRERGFAKERNNADLFNSLLSTIAVLRDEMIRRRDFWDSVAAARGDHHAPLVGIIVSGMDADLPGFADFLGLTMNMSARTASVWQNAFSLNEYIPPMSLQESLEYTTAIGLALTSSL